MTRWNRFILISVASVTIALTTLSSTGEATWLRNWIARRNAARANHYGAGLFRGRLFPGLRRPQAIVGYYPGQVPCGQSCQTTCQRTVVQYVPRTAYRTVLNRVPVTVYRPVTTIDPRTSCQTVSYRPCTTYQYQTQQVPYVAYQPVARTVSCQSPVAFQPAGGASTVCSVAPPGVIGVPGAGCVPCHVNAPGWVPVPPQNTAPTLVPTPQNIPSVTPSPGVPAIPSSPGQLTPTDPADQSPALPRTYQAPAGPAQGAGYRSDVNTPGPEPAQPSVNVPALRPLPNLDEGPSHAAPALIAPGQRTASVTAIHLVGAVSEIEWPSTRSTYLPQVNAEQESVEPNWDDSGWHSAE